MISMARIGIALFFALMIFPYPCLPQDCDPKKLDRAKEFFGLSDYVKAKPLLQQLENCPSPIGEEAKQLLDKITESSICSPIRNKAMAAHNRGNHDSACQFIAEIEKKCPNWDELAKTKRIIGECRKSPTPDEEFKQALDLHRKCDWNGAKSLLLQIKEKNPGYPGLDGEISNIQKDIDELRSSKDLRDRGRLEEARKALNRIKYRIGASCPTVDSDLESLREDIDEIKKAEKECSKGNAKNSISILEDVKDRNSSYNWLDKEIESIRTGAKCGASNPPSDFEDFMTKGRAALQYKDYFTAAGLFKRALAIRPSDSPSSKLLAEANSLAQSQRDAMHGALRAYYSGDYVQAGELLRNIVNSAASAPQSKTLAKFYLGATLLNIYYMGSENKQELKSEASNLFRQVRLETPKFAPPSTGISKRILDRFNAGQNP